MQSLSLRRVNWSTWVKVIGVMLFGVATAISARISVALPFSPVPLTLQVLVVIVSGFVLGPGAAFASQLLYLQAILLGAPLTAMGLSGPLAFASPTAGYLVAFPLAAAVVGWVSHRRMSDSIVWRGLGGVAGLAIIYGLGSLWLSGYVGGLDRAWQLGVAPFVAADALKVIIASVGLSALRRV